MPKIMFWNVQGSGGDTIRSSAGDILLGDLSELIDLHKPDVIVLCELRGGFEQRFGALYGYETLKIHGGYPAATTYRFGAFVRSAGYCSISHDARLISDAGNRPALSFVVNQVGLLAVHAPSVSNSTTPQLNHIQSTVKQCSGMRTPKVILGDLNIDLRTRRDQVISVLQNAPAPLPDYWLRPASRNPEPTHLKGGTLDWALVQKNFNTSYKVAKTMDGGPQKSDHWPICISWS